MILRGHEDIAPGHAAIVQDGEIIIARLSDLRYEPDDDDVNVIMIVNPVDVEAAKAMWFEPKGAIQ